MKRQYTAFLLVFCLSILMILDPFPPPLLAAPVVGKPQVSQPTIPVGQPTELTITCQVTCGPTDPPVIPTGVNLLRLNTGNVVISNLGVMRDDGTNGDAVAGDGIFTLRITVNETGPGQMRLQASAAFYRQLKRTLSEITIVRIVANSPPVANAGGDQNVTVGDIVTLDGRNSSDPEGDLITYNWMIKNAPMGSSCALTNPTSVIPSFIPDKAGIYTISLTVNDGKVNSTPAEILIKAALPNVAPTAYAGPDQSVVTGSRVYLDGTGSYDPEGQSLKYKWQILSLPVGSNAFLDYPFLPTPTFIADKDGQYIIQLTVNDGELDSLPDDTIVISARPNAPPIAYAGNDQTVSRNALISLDGTGSSDPDNDPLVYNWSIVSRPVGSISNLDNPNSPTPKILADRSGDYVLRLIVNDGLLDSNPDTVVITVQNNPPIANAGPDMEGVIGTLLTLDGSGSSDPDGDPLTYQWTLISSPAGSSASINNPTSINPTFTPTLAGTYTIQLVVNDGKLSSGPDTMTIIAKPPMMTVPYVVGMIQANAQSTIIASNLIVGVITTAHNPIVPIGQVISQNPDPGTSVPLGSPVSLVVSIGPVMVTVPNVVGMVQASAEAAIRAANLVVGTIATTNSTTVPAGSVISQNPASGISVAQGSPVNLVISLGPNVVPQPEGSFGEKYQDLIPPDATVQSYDSKRFSLITGLVRNLAGSPIADVSVNILGYPGYGTAKTDTQGRFSIPVEGGGILTITYKKAGLITTQRKVYVPWNDIAVAETIVMIPEDPASTTLTFDRNPNKVVTHQSSIVSDERGSRSSTVVFTGDNRAYSVDASGSVIQELTTITTRTTEFTTEQSMPAKLPPTSAYTYCVELGVDGVQRVRFDKPVILWIDNFLGFAVGQRVPVGYYDRDKGVWVPSDNGVVVRLLDTNGDGIVDALDANGDGLPDDLNGDGSFRDEVMGLNDPRRYPPGSTFWRVQVTHFSPWDCNWPYGPPADAVAPNPTGIPNADQQKKEEDDCRRSTSSFVEERSRIFHEDVPIPGTDMTLHYTSRRVKGFQQMITVPASGETVPPSLKRIIVAVGCCRAVF